MRRAKRILVVDDEPEVAAVLEELLHAEGHVVDLAEDGKAALAKLTHGSYDVIVSDIRMPKLDGVELYRLIGERDGKLLRRFVFLTGDTATPRTQEFLAHITAPCLNKPFTLWEIRLALQHVLAIDGQP